MKMLRLLLLLKPLFAVCVWSGALTGPQQLLQELAVLIILS